MIDENTSRIQLVEALADERRLMRTLIDNLPDGIYIKDTQSRFVLGNTTVAELMGVSTPEQLIGKTDFDFFPYDLASSYYEDEQTVMGTGTVCVKDNETTS
ncbi:MAG: PAS domain-containing protein [Anaerolineae bacterium]|nr:PAS domain-containing protein [Anaerolineae bacterium]